MKIPFRHLSLLVLGGLLFSACNLDDTTKPATGDMGELSFPMNFNFSTQKKLSVNINAKANNTGLPKTNLYFYDGLQGEGNLLFTGVTDANGVYKEEVMLPIHVQKLYVYSDILPNYELDITNKSDITMTMGDEKAIIGGGLKKGLAATAVYKYGYLGTYNSLGVPNYLENPGDVLDAAFNSFVSQVLPETKSVPVNNPQYLADGNSVDIRLSKDADVWVTFVHEGASFTNTLGYYTYDLASPPATKAAIDTMYVIFPNVSYTNSGGGLAKGNKVKLGRFKANTGIGWFLVANGWKSSTQSVGNGSFTHYSTPSFNVETNPDLQQHNVLIADNARQLILLGFEDQRRDNPACDQDFNDALFYITANPFDAIVCPSCAPPATEDCDSDGVSDNTDDYPCDPIRSKNNFTTGTLAYEDLYPAKGDYDFNDLVVDYQFNRVQNATNNVVELKGRFIVKAIGAAFTNGFAFELPINSSVVSAVTGNRITEGILSFNGNGTEAGHTKAVIVAFDNAFKIAKRPSGYFVNTQMAAPIVKSDTINVTVSFTSPISVASLGSAPFNPFIFVNKERGKEVHLAGYTPTNLVNVTYFGKSADRTSVANGIYYKTSNGLPFALHIPTTSFTYPIEKSAISNGYLKFVDWGVSGGTLFADWYSASNSEYRNASFLYTK